MWGFDKTKGQIPHPTSMYFVQNQVPRVPHPSSNTEDGAHLDFSANGFWGWQCEKTYINNDVKVFNPHAPSNRSTDAKSITGNMNCLRNIEI